jgi:hypothetical protein
MGNELSPALGGPRDRISFVGKVCCFRLFRTRMAAKFLRPKRLVDHTEGLDGILERLLGAGCFGLSPDSRIIL